MSSEMGVRIPHPEYPRFPWPRSSSMGEAILRSGHSKYGVADGLPVNIPVLGFIRYDLGRDGDG